MEQSSVAPKRCGLTVQSIPAIAKDIFCLDSGGHGAVWTILIAPHRNDLTYLLTYCVVVRCHARSGRWRSCCAISLSLSLSLSLSFLLHSLGWESMNAGPGINPSWVKIVRLAIFAINESCDTLSIGPCLVWVRLSACLCAWCRRAVSRRTSWNQSSSRFTDSHGSHGNGILTWPHPSRYRTSTNYHRLV